MSLDNLINKTWNHLSNFKNKLVSNTKKAVYAGLITSLVLTSGTRISKAMEHNSLQDKLNNSFVDDGQDQFIAQPEIGYVIKSETIEFMDLNNILKSFEDVDIKPIKGLDRKGVSVVYNNNTKTENENTIQALKTYSQIQYAAPLFSINKETVAVLPEIVVKLKNKANFNQLQDLCETTNLTIKKRMDYTNNEYLINVLGNDANDVFNSVRQLSQAPFIKWASPNLGFQPKLCQRPVRSNNIPNDKLFPRQWHLNNTGQSGGTPNADINAPEAWEITNGGDPNIVVAVLDNGVEYNHPDLFHNIWVNPNIVEDTNSDGVINIHDVDLNQNGSIEENELNIYGTDKGIIGWDFIDDDNSPGPLLSHPSNAHGTACAGLIAAKGNNCIGVTGVAYNCKIMPIRIMSDINNFATYADNATAIRWAAENGADILSNSWGFPMSISPIIRSAIIDVTIQGGIGREEKGCVFLASSGNWENGGPVMFPAKYAEVIAVGATNHNDLIWNYSGHGSELEIVAPSGNWTTDITGGAGYNNNYTDISSDYTNEFSGTSSACPVAAGTAALILSTNPNLTGNEVRRILSRSAKSLRNSGWNENYGNGGVDAYAAVNMALNIPSPTLFVDDDAINDPWPGYSEISNPLENGSPEHPFDSIQEAINLATPKDRVIVLPGIYKGEGNRNIDFRRKSIIVHSKDGPGTCIIDCQNLDRGFYFHGREKADSILKGFTIINGNANNGGGIMCANSSPTISNCILANNSALFSGGGIYTYNNHMIKDFPTLINCTFYGNLAENGGGMINRSLSSPKITNCIFWENWPEEISTLYDGKMPEITYSNIKGGWPGLGNINANPLFADPNNNDYHLKSQAGRWDTNIYEWVHDNVTSPCIDAGDPNSPLENELLHIPDDPNNPNVTNLRINMGAYGGTPEASFAPYTP